MDNQTYLNQISASSTTTTTSTAKEPFFPPKVVKLLVAGVVAALLIIILSAVLSANNNNDRSLTEHLNARTTNLIETVTKYNKYIHSSELRSIGSSFLSTLTDTNTNISKYLSDTYNINQPATDITDEEANSIAELNQDLETARLNNLLDNVYASKMSSQILLLLASESELLARTKDTNLTQLIENSSANLTTIRNTFENYNINNQ